MLYYYSIEFSTNVSMVEAVWIAIFSINLVSYNFLACAILFSIDKYDEDIFPSYEKALNRDDGRSTILVEFGDYHNEK